MGAVTLAENLLNFVRFRMLASQELLLLSLPAARRYDEVELLVWLHHSLLRPRLRIQLSLRCDAGFVVLTHRQNAAAQTLTGQSSLVCRAYLAPWSTLLINVVNRALFKLCRICCAATIRNLQAFIIANKPLTIRRGVSLLGNILIHLGSVHFMNGIHSEAVICRRCLCSLFED